ncbi:carbonic anhydrase family protein [Pseudanabaena sp. FACHB-1998]|uniref:carbonic anhydrase n=1 Tax=Pseudanabaena sp. FACHB-1998 TaxID=2692858 RepID=UPI0016801199|nr:carbonic anhydrase family protein [Pseudanabaena sp. FACHB-1998]MBD2176102.1 carbonic anhydrase family protein [Pseudanabaena sp. FACHB-1998]
MDIFNWKLIKKIVSLIIITGALWIGATSIVLAEDSTHWGYGGSENPTQWSSLSKNFALCELGKSQSPINITNSYVISGNQDQIEFNYLPSSLEIINNGHTIQVNYDKGSSVTINGEKYELVQFHFHTPSEHNINSKAYAMELHLVHRNASGTLAVVGVMIQNGRANPLIAEIWGNIPAIKTTKLVSDRQINVSELLPMSRAYYSYDGSLTTPPCSEGVKWNVFAEPITISEEQIQEFQKLYQVDARPIQSSNSRLIKLHL